MLYDDSGSLGSLLEIVVDNYEQEREEYWADDEVGTARLEFVDSVARTLLEASHDFAATQLVLDDVPFEYSHVQFLSNIEGIRERVHERIQIDIAYQACGSVRASADRCLELTTLVLKEKPNEKVLRFLQRLSRCYVAGFLPECVILCRSILENAVVEAYERKGLPLPADDTGRSTMRARLDSAVRCRLISDEADRAAWTVWTRGNKAIHYDPEATSDVYGTIQLTVDVLNEVYG